MTIRIPLLVLLAAAVPVLSEPRLQGYGAHTAPPQSAQAGPAAAAQSAHAGPAAAGQSSYGGSAAAHQSGYGGSAAAHQSGYEGPAAAFQRGFGGSAVAPQSAHAGPAEAPHRGFGAPAVTPQSGYGGHAAATQSAYAGPAAVSQSEIYAGQPAAVRRDQAGSAAASHRGFGGSGFTTRAPQRGYGTPTPPPFRYHQVRFVSPAVPRSYPVVFPDAHQAPTRGAYGPRCQTISARMDILSGVSQEISGVLFFYQECPEQPVQVTGRITGLSPGKHGLHVHGTPNLGNNCSDAGGHFNPFKADHGAQTDPIQNRHVGDLGNIEADYGGVADINIQDSIISLFPGDRNIIRRAIVVHSGEDDLGRGGNEGSLKTGNAGKRLGCGVIAPNNPPL